MADPSCSGPWMPCLHTPSPASAASCMSPCPACGATRTVRFLHQAGSDGGAGALSPGLVVLSFRGLYVHHRNLVQPPLSSNSLAHALPLVKHASYNALYPLDSSLNPLSRWMASASTREHKGAKRTRPRSIPRPIVTLQTPQSQVATQAARRHHSTTHPLSLSHCL